MAAEAPAPAPAAPAPAPATPAMPKDPKMQSAVNFLLDPSVMGMPGPKLTPYLKQRLGLTDDQVKEAFKLAGAAPRPRQDKIMTAVEFLENEQVKDKPLEMKVTYLKTKLEMTDPEIAAALSQVAGPAPPEAVQKAISFLQTGAHQAFDTPTFALPPICTPGSASPVHSTEHAWLLPLPLPLSECRGRQGLA
jgi:hypothetical protein